MKLWPVMALVCLFLASGCSSGGGGEVDANSTLPKGAGVAQNPSGQPRDAQEQQMADLQRKSGESAANHMADAAKAMEEAKKRTGGK